LETNKQFYLIPKLSPTLEFLTGFVSSVAKVERAVGDAAVKGYIVPRRDIRSSGSRTRSADPFRFSTACP